MLFLTRRNYHVIVMEGNTSSKNPNEWQPSELGPYDASAYKTGKPYITAVLSSYVSKFSVGDGKKYSLSNRKRRNVGSVTYENVPLKANTEYLIFQRAYVSQVTMLLDLIFKTSCDHLSLCSIFSDN